MDNIDDSQLLRELRDLLKSNVNETPVLELLETFKAHIKNIEEVNENTRLYLKDVILKDFELRLNDVVQIGPDGYVDAIIKLKSIGVLDEYIKFMFPLDDYGETIQLDDNLQPIQPLYAAEFGRLRFRDNAIVSDMLDYLHRHEFNSDDIFDNKWSVESILSDMQFSKEDCIQFLQLIGYSIEEFTEFFPTDTDAEIIKKAKRDYGNGLNEVPEQPVIDGKRRKNEIVVYLEKESRGIFKLDKRKYNKSDVKQFEQLLGN